MPRHLKDAIAASAAPPIVAMLFCAILWWPSTIDCPLAWAGLGGCALTAILARSISNQNRIIRIRTWLTPTVFLCMVGAIAMLHGWNDVWIGTVCYALSLLALLGSYEQLHPERWVFQAFLTLGCTVLTCPQLICLVVGHLLAMAVQLRSLTLRSLLAAVWGLAVVTVFFVGICLGTGHDVWLTNWAEALSLGAWATDTHWVANYWHWEPTVVVSLAVVLLILLAAVIHFVQNSYNDKISARMFLYTLIIQSVLLLAILLLWPVAVLDVLPFLILSGSPAIAHYFALGRGWLANLAFWLSLIIILTLTVYTQWMPWLISL